MRCELSELLPQQETGLSKQRCRILCVDEIFGVATHTRFVLILFPTF